MGKRWLLDTSVFYWCASKEAQGRLRDAADGALLQTAPSSALEILSGMGIEKSFSTRRKALRALVALCGEDGLLRPDSDALVASAFGRQLPELDLDRLWEGVVAASEAAAAGDVVKGMPDYVAKVIRKVAVEHLRDWDAAIGEGFRGDMDAAGYEKTDPVLLELVKAEGVEGKDAKLLARLLQAIAITESDESRRFALVGLAVRAGAIDEARVPRDMVGVDLDAICKEAEQNYQGSLNGFVQIYRHYHGYTALARPKVGINDALDLDPLLYFDSSDAEQHYVTGEDLWLKVVNLAFEGRAIDVKPIAKRPGT
jgi:hypothetical protein